MKADLTTEQPVPGTGIRVYINNDWVPCSKGCPGWFIAEDQPHHPHMQDFEAICKCDDCGRFRYDVDAALWNFREVFTWHRNTLGPGSIEFARYPRELSVEAGLLRNALKRFEAEDAPTAELEFHMESFLSVDAPKLFAREDFRAWLAGTGPVATWAPERNPNWPGSASDTWIYYGGEGEGSNPEMPGFQEIAALADRENFVGWIRLTDIEE